MSIERNNHDEIAMVCDGCGEVEQTEHTDFFPALAEVKQVGWRAKWIDESWQHFCKDCAA